MRTNRLILFIAAGMPVVGTARSAVELDPITIERESAGVQRIRPLDPAGETGADTAGLVKQAPGGHTADNGPLSSQVQYRGLFGPRMNVQLNGMTMTPGGPNWMDPPLHYLPPSQVTSLELQRGIAPVSQGAQSLGGTLEARARSSTFTATRNFITGGRVGLRGRSVNDGLSGDVFVETANRNHRFHAAAVRDQGNDTEFGDGEIAASEFERNQARIGYGVRGEAGRFGVEYSRTETGDSGNPSLPLDIKLFDTDILHLTYGRQWGGVKLEASLGGQFVEHQMTNFRLRAPPGPRRRVEATGDSVTTDLDLSWPGLGGRWRAGVHLLGSRHEQDILDPDNPAFFVTQFNDADARRASTFGEWEGALARRWRGRFGLRVTSAETEAGRGALAPGLPRPAQNLRARFNAGERQDTDVNTDAVAQLDWQVSETSTLTLGVGRKTRSPSHIERYLWLPNEVSAGLGDGNNYVGNPRLDPEVNREFNLGLDWTSGGHYLRPQLYYRDIRDFIAGTPVDATPGTVDSDVERVSAGNGDATPLRYSNIDAEMYGLDLEWRHTLTARWHLDGLISVVRGERASGDPLFRMPADSAVTAITWSRRAWSLRLESELHAEQSEISETLVKNEPFTENADTAGYGLVNVSARWRSGSGLRVHGGVENLLDQDHSVHTKGFNRVRDSDVAVGERLPGAGHNLYLHLAWAF